MTIAILATGDEILHGDTLNTNAHVIAHVLSSDGLSLGLHIACSDREQDIVNCLEFLSQEHQIIILIGGLGPTSDDRTRFALARFVNTPLIEFKDALKHVEERLLRANLSFTASNRQQAMFPSEATLLPNPQGTAMGCWFKDEVRNQLFIMLPGPPKECLPMFEQFVLPRLQQTQHSTKQLLKWRLFGVAEGAISERLDTALAHLACQTGYRLETPYLEFKVRCRQELVADVLAIIEPLVLKHVIAPPEQRASERLRLKIEQMKQLVVIEDDVTGGVLQTLLQRPSSYRWVKFHTTTQAAQFSFRLGGLEAFWEHDGDAVDGKEITIDYNIAGQRGTESHALPYYSANVVHYAAEWLSFRLFQIIDQLHQGVA